MKQMGKMFLEKMGDKYGNKIMDLAKNLDVDVSVSPKYPINSMKNHRNLGPFPLVPKKKIKPGQAEEEIELINKQIIEYSDLESKKNEEIQKDKENKQARDKTEAENLKAAANVAGVIGEKVIDSTGNTLNAVAKHGTSLLHTFGVSIVNPGISATSSVVGSLFSTGTGTIKEGFRAVTNGRGIAMILWIIVIILLIVFIVLLLIGGIGTLSSGGDSNNKSTCSDLTLVEINDVSQYTRYGITTNNYSMPLNFRPSFISQPNFNLFNMDYYSNYLATTEPFASVYSYANMMAYIASGGSKNLIDRKPLATSRCNSVVSAKGDDGIVNVLKPKDIEWTLKESENPELQTLPPTYRDAVLKDKYTVKIPWKKDDNGNNYTIDCTKIYYGNNINNTINILDENCKIIETTKDESK